jgi:hypothetical protein
MPRAASEMSMYVLADFTYKECWTFEKIDPMTEKGMIGRFE